MVGQRVRALVRQHAGVRATTSLTAAFVLALALALGGVLLLVLLRRALVQGIEDTARQRAADVAAAVTQESAEPGVDVDLVVGSGNVVQVLDGQGVVVASKAVQGRPPMTVLRPAPGRTAVGDARAVLADRDETFRVVAQGVRTSAGHHYVVVAAQSLEPAGTALRTLAGLLALGIPLLVVVAGATTFVLSGRALRPVEDIRRRVADVESTQLGLRVPVPAARDEVARLAETMNDMLERLEDAASAQRRFISDASHELRSPLATIRTTLEVATAYPDLADRASTDGVLLAETERLQALVADLLLLARTDEHGPPLSRADVDVDDLCEQEVKRLQHLGVDVSARIAPARVTGDGEQLGRLLRNLVDNAARHAQCSVSLTCRVDGDAVEVDVQDDGAGIPPADRMRAFERFVRLDESRTRAAGGTGLGLAIAAQVARAHGGAVSFVDPPGGTGACARLRLPRTR